MTPVTIPPLVLTLLLVLVGLVHGFAGYRIFRFVIGLAGFGLGAAVTTAALQSVTANQVVILVGALFGGLLGAGVLSAVYLLGVFVVGAYVGFLLGVVVDDQVVAHLGPLFWGAVALACGIAALVIQRVVIILSTALLGALLVVLSFDYEFLLRPDPNTLDLSPLQLLLALLLGVAGAIAQFRTSEAAARSRRKPTSSTTDERG